MEEQRKRAWRIEGLRSPGAVVIKGVKGDLEIVDSEVGSLIVEDDPGGPDDGPQGIGAIVGNGLLQVALSVVAAGASQALGIS